MAPGSPNEELAWRIVGRWNDGDRDALLELVDPDTELHSRLGELRGKPYVGVEGFKEWIADVDDHFSGFRIIVDELDEAHPGRIVASGSAELRGRGSDLPWVQETVWILEIDEGRLRKMHIYTDREAGLRAAGLS